MAVDSTNLLEEVRAIIAEGPTQSPRHYAVQIKVGNEWLRPLRLDGYNLYRDYELDFGDVRIIEVLMLLGDYAYALYPYRDDLWVDVFTSYVSEQGGELREDMPIRHQRFRAILMEQNNPGLTSMSPQASSREDLNHNGTQSVQLQLLEENLHQVRMISVGRIYRKVTPMAVLRSLLTETTELLNVNQQQHIFGVDVVGIYNTAEREHIVIPHGTPLTKVVSLLQNEEGGLYATGAGCYLQQGEWYVYSLYDPTRVRRDPKTLTIIRVPPNRFGNAERTYRTSDNQVVIIASGQITTSDEGLNQQLNEGNALRVTNAHNLLTPGQTGNNKVTLARAENVYEFQGTELTGGLTHARWAGERATANPYKHYSDIARRNGRYLYVEWAHADIDLLYPGMPVKFLNAVNDELGEYQGVLLGVNEQRLPNRAGAVADSYPATTLLKVFLTRLNQL